MGLWYWIITLTCSIIIFICLLFSRKMVLLVKQPQLSTGFLKKNQQKIWFLQNANNCHSYKTARLTFEWWPQYKLHQLTLRMRMINWHLQRQTFGKCPWQWLFYLGQVWKKNVQKHIQKYQVFTSLLHCHL